MYKIRTIKIDQYGNASATETFHKSSGFSEFQNCVNWPKDALKNERLRALIHAAGGGEEVAREGAEDSVAREKCESDAEYDAEVKEAYEDLMRLYGLSLEAEFVETEDGRYGIVDGHTACFEVPP